MKKIIEARILLEEFGDLARQNKVVEFIEILKNNCSVMLFDDRNLCYKLMFKEEYWKNSILLFPDLERFYFKEECE
jgi:hypothetical protein